MESNSSQRLLEHFRAGEFGAADALFNRYVSRLIELARVRISPRLAPRIDAEDIVQSAYRSFFLRASDGQFSLERSGDLWRLLVAITLHKLHHQVDRHHAQRRDVRQEISASDESHGPIERHASVEPTPAEAAALAEQVTTFMKHLSDRERLLLERRLQGDSIAEIAAAVERSERTVRRMLAEMQAALEAELRI